jgi:hypothetical protein
MVIKLILHFWVWISPEIYLPKANISINHSLAIYRWILHITKIYTVAISALMIRVNQPVQIRISVCMILHNAHQTMLCRTYIEIKMYSD